jgi:serine/threonine-protein kinase HipA
MLHFPIIQNQSGSSPGGERPKALCRKEDGSLWIVKFPRHQDIFQVESIEAATLELAKRSGLTVPEFEIRNLGKRKILLVKRFDISDRGSRYHMISMQTLLQAHGYYFLGYQNMFDAVNAHSYQPSEETGVDIEFQHKPLSQKIKRFFSGNMVKFLALICRP